ncbi:MAG: phosphomannomutase/phosphoglucomutase [Polyangiaceae bacterium]
MFAPTPPMKTPAHAFREYDIRSIADRDLTSPLVQAIGLAFGTILRDEGVSKPRIAVARDCRLSSNRIRDALVEGLLSAGCDVVDVGVGPTPMLYFAAHSLGTDGAIMVTGSHNPPDENGLKIMRGKSSFFGEDIQKLRQRVEADPAPASTRGTLSHSSVEDAYVDALVTRSRRPGDAPRSKVKVVLDAGNGSGGPLGLRAMQAAGLDVEPLFCEMDGSFPNHHPDPTQPKNLVTLIERVKATGATVGLAYDGDADRLGAVDANGDIIWGDRLLLLFARDILVDHPGAGVIGEVKCSQTTYDDIAAHGGKAILWKTGHSLIKAKMKEEHALLAGEMSGHLFLADRWFGFDDALYAGLRLVDLLERAGKTIGELTSDVPRTSITPELRVDCPDDQKFALVSAIRDRYRKSYEVIDVDGARILFGDTAWGLVRASNTQPVLVLRFEARNDARRDALRAEVEAAIEEERHRLFG